MKSLEAILLLLRQQKSYFQEQYHVLRMSVFGSVARGEVTEASDVDILLEFSKPIGLDLVCLAEELERLLGVRVDAIPKDAIKPRLWPYVEKDLIDV
jgi:predicted nucleotidyltransferase